MKPPHRRALLRSALSVLVLPASLLLAAPLPATAQVGVSIGIHIGSYPNLVRVPSYPVYYAPGLPVNLFFYDGLYWVFVDDRWYTSPWYDGPWDWVDPFAVPLYVLRVPVRYYRAPPPYFRAWRPEGPPRWDAHWGADWRQRHPGWDRWNRRAAPAPAPLPTYQRQYSGHRYPRPDEQRALLQRHYRYQPREAVAREHIPPGPAQPPGQRHSSPPPTQRPGPEAQRPPRLPDRPDGNHPPARQDNGPPRRPAEPERPRDPRPERRAQPPQQPPQLPQGQAQPRPEPRRAEPERGGPPGGGNERGQGHGPRREEPERGR